MLRASKEVRPLALHQGKTSLIKGKGGCPQHLKYVKEKRSLHMVLKKRSSESTGKCHIWATSWEAKGQKQASIRQMKKHLEFGGTHKEWWSCAYFPPWQRELQNVLWWARCCHDGADGLGWPPERLNFYSSIPRTTCHKCAQYLEPDSEFSRIISCLLGMWSKLFHLMF